MLSIIDVLPGWSLMRDFYGTDTNNNAADFTPCSSPTPGSAGIQPLNSVYNVKSIK
ncbi:hypothetical protein HY745_06230 [Candidatus Desantisbacteria bacterium]|nr:hypothetical protein [Candidatus Desantisbacteria bacterium]